MPLASLAFAVSVAYLPGILSSAVAPRWWVILIGAPLLMLAAPRVRMTAMHWLGLLFLAIAGASAFWSVAPIDTWMGLAELAALAMVFCVAAEAEDLGPAWIAIGLGCAINTAAALLQLAVPGSIQGMGLGALFYHQDQFGAFAAVALIGLTLAVDKSPAIYALIVAVAFGLILSASRGAMMAFVIASLAYALTAAPRQMRRQAWTGAIILTTLVAAVLLAIYPGREQALTVRWANLTWVAQNLRLFGWGWNTLGSIFPFEHLDNDWAEVISDLGILSIALVPLTYGVLKDSRHAPASFAALVCLAADGLTSFPLHSPATLMVAAMAAGHLSGSGRPFLLPGLWRSTRNFGHPGFIAQP